MLRKASLPSGIRRINGEEYRRLATFTSDFTMLQRMAAYAREHGYNARILRNKHSASVYVRPKWEMDRNWRGRSYNDPLVPVGDVGLMFPAVDTGRAYSREIPDDAEIDPRWLAPRTPNPFGKPSQERMKEEAARFIYYKVHIAGEEAPPSSEIRAHLNRKFSWGVTPNQLSNYLSRDPRFISTGTLSAPAGPTTPRVREEQWILSPPVAE